jgi:hypothetical protein
MTVVWGIVGMLVGVLIAAQLAWPALKFDTAWLSFGRLRPLHTNAVIFAFGGCALMSTSLFIAQRTCHARLISDKLAAFVFWGWQLVRGMLTGLPCRIGQPAFTCPGTPGLEPPAQEWLWILLCSTRPLAWIGLQDTLRPDARAMLAALQGDCLRTALFSGDPSASGLRLARSLPLDEVQTGMSPEQKIAAVRAEGERGTVMMVSTTPPPWPPPAPWPSFHATCWCITVPMPHW